VLSALLALYETSGMQTFSYHLNQIVLVLGVAAFWSITGVAIQTGVHKMVWVLSAYSFFVFATHEPVLEILRKLLIRVPDAGDAVGLPGLLYPPAGRDDLHDAGRRATARILCKWVIQIDDRRKDKTALIIRFGGTERTGGYP